MHVARVKLAVGPAWWQTWRAKCALAADGAVWGAVREHAGVLVVLSSVVRVAARVVRPGDRRSYRISSGRRGRGPGSIHNSPADGREKIRRFLIVMALARLGTGLGLISQPLSPPLSLLFSFLFAPFGSPISLGGQPASMSSRRGGAGGAAIARQGMRGLERLFTTFQQTAPRTRPTGASGLQTGRRSIMLRTGHGRCNSRRSSLGTERSAPFRGVFMHGPILSF